jgi:hypothetical protein
VSKIALSIISDITKGYFQGWGAEIEKMKLDLLRQHPMVKTPKELTDRSE